MAVEQFVNILKQDMFTKDNDGLTLDRCGRTIKIEVTFEKANMPIGYKVKVTPVGNDNATYTKKEQKQNPNFKMTRGTAGASDEKTVIIEDTIQLPAAGGNKYKIEAKDAKGNVVQTPIEIETRRKLYYQVIKMQGMQATVSILTDHLEKEFWESAKHYIKLVQIPSKGDISGFPNFDEHQQNQIPSLAKNQYSRERDPFCFAIILTDQLAASGESDISGAVTVNSRAPNETFQVPNSGFLWLDLDPPNSAESRWYLGGRFVETSTGRTYPIPSGAVAPIGKTAVSVNTSSLPNGSVGIIELKVKVVDRFRTGLSFGKNVICVATRAGWQQRANDDMKSTLVHEAGHKIGMVPDGSAGGLSKQGTYYQRNGGHCNYLTDKCVMYGMIHPGRDNRFCPKCQVSVRKLDLDGSKLPGFVPL